MQPAACQACDAEAAMAHTVSEADIAAGRAMTPPDKPRVAAKHPEDDEDWMSLLQGCMSGRLSTPKVHLERQSANRRPKTQAAAELLLTAVLTPLVLLFL
mmetsp:Transcript_124435/g.357516  ORF Transcript_124435/g.357516 Transcript_124435/m.357516 type:complete len:100 (-) Transcript_124435:62-361(-)